jgi:hypothetical protein
MMHGNINIKHKGCPGFKAERKVIISEIRHQMVGLAEVGTERQ